MLAIAVSLVEATNAGAVAVLVPETAIASAQYSPVQNNLVGPLAFACNADGCLAAWRDGRQGLGYRVWARRLRADGTPRDAAAFLVSIDTFDASDPVVATDGTSFLVGWSGGFAGMYLTRVDADDSLHSESVQGQDVGGDVGNPVAIASNGDGYLLVLGYPVGAPGGTIKALRADKSGHALDASPFLISDDPQARGIGDVIWTGTKYLVVWNQGQGDGGDAYAARVTPDGTVLDPSGHFVATLGGFSDRPRLALGAGKVLLAAGRNFGSSGGEVVAFLLDTDGKNASAVSLPIPPSRVDGMSAVAAWNGSAFVVMWIDGPTGPPVAVRIAPDGKVVDPAQIVLATPTQSETPAIAVVGTTAFIVYVDMSYQASPVRLVSFSASGAVALAAGPLDTSAAPQRLLAAARGDGQTLVIWADDGQGIYASALLAARISDAGAVLDAAPIVLSAAAPNKQGAVAAAAWAGGQYLVSWWEQTGLGTDQLQVARVSAAGAVLDAPPTVLGRNLFFSQVSAIVPEGDHFLAVWSEEGIISTPAPINAITIGSDGRTMGASFTTGTAQASYPWAVAAQEGGGALAAWNVFSGAAFGVQMETIDAAGVQGTPVHVSQRQGSIALVPAPGQTLLWLNGREGTLLSSLPPFAALSGTNIAAGRNIGAPSWNGAAYVSAGVTTPGEYDYDSVGVDVSVMSKDGVLFAPATTVVPPRQLTTLAPTVVGLAPDKNLVLYSRLVPEHDEGALRVRFQIVDSPAATTPDGGLATDGGSRPDSGAVRDGGTIGDSGAIRDGGRTVDALDGREAGVDRDASGLDVGRSNDAASETAHRDSAAPDAPAADASHLDSGRPDTSGTGGAPAPRDATADAGQGSSSGCSCTMSGHGATDRGSSSAALLLFALAAWLRRRHRA